MIEAGIEYPDSQEGIEFCLDCPYPNGCIVFDSILKPNVIKRLRNQAKANKLQAEGLTVDDIAERLGKSIRTVERYLANNYQQ